MEHIPGLQLSGYFFEEAIQPLMADHFPNLAYSAARLGYGSDVIGFDTPMSMDHGWGPKMTLFLNEKDYTTWRDAVDEACTHNLPLEIHGFPTHFGEPLEDGGKMMPKVSHPITHMVTITTPERFFQNYLGLDIHNQITLLDWLTIPQQRLRTLRAGRIYHDGLHRLTELRARFNWYPRDIWRFMMAAQWQRISQDEAFIGRTGFVGDEIGSRLLAAGIIEDLMCLAFLMEKQYAPYHKWFGTAFKGLKVAKLLESVFTAVLDAKDWRTREEHLSRAYILMANKHNALGITPPLKAEVSSFHGRPFMVLHADRFVKALRDAIQDPEVKALTPHLGSVDQIVDNTDLLEDPARCRLLHHLYTA